MVRERLSYFFNPSYWLTGRYALDHIPLKAHGWVATPWHRITIPRPLRLALHLAPPRHRIQPRILG